jgi:RND family efflux transporter MFP subunit
VSGRGVHLSRGQAILGIAGLVAAGAFGMWFWLQTTTATPPPAALASRAPARQATPLPASGEVAIDLAPDAIERAGIRVAAVPAAGPASALALPAVVAPDAYRQVVITPLSPGRVSRVHAVLGQRVRRGEILATIHSPEVADAVSRLRSARAALDAHDRERQRTEQLAAIGAASRQEVERVHAEHAAQVADVDSARARVAVLGGREASAGDAAATAEVRAPLDGTVIERAANAGLAVEAATPLFTIADLARVWIVADAFERDLGRVRLGDRATVTVPAHPGRRWEGTIGYLDPQVAAATRTARLRVELPNADGALRPGMFASVSLESAEPVAGAVAAVPRSAVQMVGDRAVVYLAGPARGRFVEREVRLGPAAGDVLAVLSGVQPGDAIVVDGSFFLRAEIERRGLRPDPGGIPTIRITPAGFEPDRLTARAGVPLRVRFRRTTAATCATELVIPSLKVRRPLPLDEDVEVTVTAAAGEIGFACGMDMLGGTIVVQ